MAAHPLPWMKLSRLTRISIESVTLCWSASVIVVVWNSDTCQVSCAANRENALIVALTTSVLRLGLALCTAAARVAMSGHWHPLGGSSHLSAR